MYVASTTSSKLCFSIQIRTGQNKLPNTQRQILNYMRMYAIVYFGRKSTVASVILSFSSAAQLAYSTRTVPASWLTKPQQNTYNGTHDSPNTSPSIDPGTQIYMNIQWVLSSLAEDPQQALPFGYVLNGTHCTHTCGTLSLSNLCKENGICILDGLQG